MYNVLVYKNFKQILKLTSKSFIFRKKSDGNKLFDWNFGKINDQTNF